MSRALVLAIALAACGKQSEGEACSEDGNCQAGFVCFRGRCTTSKSREQRLTEQSGVTQPAEKPIVGGDRVRVRQTQGEGTIFAQCAATERLTGGGCKGGDDCRSESNCSYVRSYPGKYTDDDTLGARWYCVGRGTMIAFALCQQTRAADTGSGSDAGSGSGSGLRAP